MKTSSKYFVVAFLFLLGCSSVNENRNQKDMSEIVTKPEKSYLTDAQLQALVKNELNVAVAVGDEFVIKEAAGIIALTRQAVQAMRDKDYPEARHLVAKAAAKTKLLTQANDDKAVAEVNVELMDNVEGAGAAYRRLDGVDSLLKLGDVQEARQLMTVLASEIRITRESISFPLYLKSLETIGNLIGEEKYDESLRGLKNVLNNLSFDYSVIPLPLVKAELVSKELKKLSAAGQPAYDDIRILSENAAYYIKLNELLGYGYGKIDYKKFIAGFKKMNDAISDKDDQAITKGATEILDEIRQAKDVVSAYKEVN